MSEEEIKDNLLMLKYFLQEEGDENWQDYCNAIQGLLDLYNKEKEKNEKLEIKLMEQDLFIDGLKEDRRIAVEEIQEQYYVSKDKVRENIEETIEELYEEMEELDSYDEDDNEEKRELTDMIVLLKELQQKLLEERR